MMHWTKNETTNNWQFQNKKDILFTCKDLWMVYTIDTQKRGMLHKIGDKQNVGPYYQNLKRTFPRTDIRFRDITNASPKKLNRVLNTTLLSEKDFLDLEAIHTNQIEV
jgi:hypothetical protein